VVFSKFSLRTLSVTLSRTRSMPNGGTCYPITLVILSDFFNSKTVTALDVVYALKRSGRTLYGFGA
jgi:hypothetical protein